MAILLALLLQMGGKLAWRDGDSLDAALVEAKLTGAPLMVYFTAEW